MASAIEENQNSIQRTFRHNYDMIIFSFISGVIQIISYPFRVIFRKLIGEIHFIEQLFLKLHNIFAFVSQIFFFLPCAIIFNEINSSKKDEEFLLIGLKTILFYSVFTYFVTKTRDIWSIGRPSLFQNWNLFEGICRIVLEWIKAIVVVVCLREQGIYFKPSPSYGILTFTYYLCTEKIFTEIFVKIFQHCSFDIFDDLEHLYVPLMLNIYTAIVSSLMQLHLILTSDFVKLIFVSIYFTTYLRLKDAYCNYWKTILMAQQTFENFRNASQKELEDYDDICAVCLSKMSKAKITPCNHFFHPNCLKECLKNSFLCPLCKLEF